MFSDSEGRWFSFVVEPTTLILLEKKSLPGHLSSLECLEQAVTLQSLIMDLQDAGEAARLREVHVNFIKAQMSV